MFESPVAPLWKIRDSSLIWEAHAVSWAIRSGSSKGKRHICAWAICRPPAAAGSAAAVGWLGDRWGLPPILLCSFMSFAEQCPLASSFFASTSNLKYACLLLTASSISSNRWWLPSKRNVSLLKGTQQLKGRDQFSSVAQSCPTLCDPWGHMQHARLPCPSPVPGIYSNSCPLSQWCHPTISSSVVPFSSRLRSFPASGSFLVSQFFASGSQSIRGSASASVLPMNIQDWFPLGWSGWISLQSKGLSRVFSNTTVQKHRFFGAQLSLQSISRIHTWVLEKP